MILYQSLKTKSHTYLLSLSVRLSQCQQRYQHPGIHPKLTFVNCFRQLYSVKYSVEIKYISKFIDQSLNSTQRRNEGLPKMQRAAMQLTNIQTFYSQLDVRLKIIVKYCHFCFEDLVFSKVCLDNFLV